MNPRKLLPVGRAFTVVALPQDMEFRRGLAGCLAGIGAILLGIAFELAVPLLGFPGPGGFIGFLGFLIAIAGAIYGAVGVVQMEHATRQPAR